MLNKIKFALELNRCVRKANKYERLARKARNGLDANMLYQRYTHYKKRVAQLKAGK